jgi:hypothetical protein
MSWGWFHNIMAWEYWKWLAKKLFQIRAESSSQRHFNFPGWLCNALSRILFSSLSSRESISKRPIIYFRMYHLQREAKHLNWLRRDPCNIQGKLPMYSDIVNQSLWFDRYQCTPAPCLCQSNATWFFTRKRCIHSASSWVLHVDVGNAATCTQGGKNL